MFRPISPEPETVASHSQPLSGVFRGGQEGDKDARHQEQTSEGYQSHGQMVTAVRFDAMPQDVKSQKGDDQKDAKADEKTDAEKLAEKQDELNKEFEEFEKSVAELDSLGKELDKDGETPSKEQMDQAKQSQQQSKQ